MASIPPSLSGLLGPLVQLLEAPSVQRVVVDRPGRATVITSAGRRTVPIELDAAALTHMARGLAQRAARELGEAQPVVEAMLRDGTRFLVVGPPLLPGPVVSVSRPATVGEAAWGELAAPLTAGLCAGLNVLVVSARGAGLFLAVAALQHCPRAFALGPQGRPAPLGAVRLGTDSPEQAWRIAAGLSPDRVFLDDPSAPAAWAAIEAMSRRASPVTVLVSGRTAADGLARLEGQARAGAPGSAGASVDGLIASGLDLVVADGAQGPRVYGIRAERGMPMPTPLVGAPAVEAYLEALGVRVARPEGEAKTVVARVSLPSDATDEGPAASEPSPGRSRPAPGELEVAGEAAESAKSERSSGAPADLEVPALVADTPSAAPSEPPPPAVAASAADAPMSLADGDPDGLGDPDLEASVAPPILAPPSVPPDEHPAASLEAPGPDPEGILVSASEPAAPAPEDSIDIEIDLSMVTKTHSVTPHDSLGGVTQAEQAAPKDRPTEDPLRALLESLGADDDDDDEDESVNTMVSQLDDALGGDAADALAGRSFSEILRSISGSLEDDSVDRARPADLPRGRRGSTRVHPEDD